MAEAGSGEDDQRHEQDREGAKLLGALNPLPLSANTFAIAVMAVPFRRVARPVAVGCA